MVEQLYDALSGLYIACFTICSRGVDIDSLVAHIHIVCYIVLDLFPYLVGDSKGDPDIPARLPQPK